MFWLARYWWDETSGESRWHVPESPRFPSTSGRGAGRDLENKGVENMGGAGEGLRSEDGERWGGRAFGDARGFDVMGVWAVWDGPVPRRVDAPFLERLEAWAGGGGGGGGGGGEGSGGVGGSVAEALERWGGEEDEGMYLKPTPGI